MLPGACNGLIEVADQRQPSCSILAKRTYSAQALRSLSSNSSTKAELPGSGSVPFTASHLTVSSSSAILLNLAWSLARTGFGTPFGVCTDHQAVRSVLVMPVSPALGMS